MNLTTFYRKDILIKLIIVLLFPTQLFSQNLVGLWTGKVYTTDKTLPYEIAISEKDGKLSGFSYTTFTVKGEEMVAVKSIVVRREKNNIIIEDEDLVFNSFDEESPKQLKQTNTLQLEIVNDKTMLLLGKFKTLKTKEFRSLTGGIRLRKDSIIENPRLIAKLDEMELSKSLSFMQPKAEPQADIAKLDKVIVEAAIPPLPEKEITSPTVTTPAPVIKPPLNPVTTSPSKSVPVKAPVKASVKMPPPVASNMPVKKAPQTIAVIKPVPAVKPIAIVAAPASVPVVKKAATKVAANAFASSFGNRTIETIQTVVFKSDSLTLTLYDNGEVDGDTVSVLLNGKAILSKQRLSTNAITKTIYMTPDLGDSLQLIMYAENLGSLPPNTGLLIIKDGRDRYEIRFAGDLTKNAAIILKRRIDN